MNGTFVFYWAGQSLSVNGNAFRDSANRNLQMLLGFGKFHGFATAVWNFALLFHLVGICGKLQPSICGKVAEKDVDIFWILLNKMWKIVDTNVDNSKLFLWNYRDLRSHDFARSASGYALAAKCIHFFMTSWCTWVQHRPWISPRAARKYFQYITPFS